MPIKHFKGKYTVRHTPISGGTALQVNNPMAMAATAASFRNKRSAKARTNSLKGFKYGLGVGP